MPQQSIVAISPPSVNDGLNGSPQSPSPSSNDELPTGAVVGIAVGVVVLFAILAVFGFFWLRQRRRRVDSQTLQLPQRSQSGMKVKNHPMTENSGNSFPQIAELSNETKYEMYHTPTEDASGCKYRRSELPSPEPTPQLLSDYSEDMHKQRMLQTVTYEMSANGERRSMGPTVEVQVPRSA
jgi:hypothetical protein